MYRILAVILSIMWGVVNAQDYLNSPVEFTPDLEQFGNLSALKESLIDVDIVALGENTHGLGEVFKAKTELVKFLHEELGFNLVLFETGFGDAALAWEMLDSLSTTQYTKSFSSNFYYHSEEIMDLMDYVKSHGASLEIQGLDCQPQQDFLAQRMTEIIQPIDSSFANTVKKELRSFNNMYQLEYNEDSAGFYLQRDRFCSFLADYDQLLTKNESAILQFGTTVAEIEAMKKSNSIFRDTYCNMKFGHLTGWPISANIRDRSLCETVNWFKEKYENAKIIIWAQNSHIENQSKPDYNVQWMGHELKRTYKEKYYSIGSIVYSGSNLNYDGSFEFEHDSTDFLAYHLNQTGHGQFVVDLRNYSKEDFTNQLLLGMESYGALAAFVARNRFDGLLFIKYSDIPQPLGEE